MAQIDVLKAKIVRDNVSTPWGFRLQGGANEGLPLTVGEITPGSPANRLGLKESDEVTHVGDVCVKRHTRNDACDLINNSDQILLLTLERRAFAMDHFRPVMSPPPISAGSPQGFRPYQRSRTAPVVVQRSDFQTVTSRPFTPPSCRQTPRTDNSAVSSTSTPPVRVQDTVDFAEQFYPAYYQQPSTSFGPQYSGSQSRKFKELKGVMHYEDKYYEEPYGGQNALPPVKSAYLQEQRFDEIAKKQNAARVKVFMPQQYNNPMGLYSAPNVVSTFQNQAEHQLQQMEQRGGQQFNNLTPTQRAVLNDDAGN